MKVKPREEKLVRRGEWSIYKKLIQRRSELYRLPVFSDYGIEFRENLAPIRGAMPSAKLNYTTEESYFFVKGENVKTGGYRAIFPVAKKVVDSTHFMGPELSAGDARILLLAQQRGSTGNAPTWRWACADHHLAVVTKALIMAFGIPITEPFKLITEQQTELFPTVPAE